MDPNTLRRLNYLWKHRHKHDTDVALQSDLLIIKELVNTQADQQSSSFVGAHIHLSRNATQSIAISGETISWDTESDVLPRLTFADPSLPATQITIPVEGYYNVDIQAGWSSHTDGGTVEVRRVREGSDPLTVWPPDDDPGEWTATDGQLFEGTAPMIPCLKGDLLEVFIDHDDSGSAQTLASATLSIGLIEVGRRDLYKAVVLQSGPLAYWRLDETSGTTAADIAGHASGPFDATYTNSPDLGQSGVMTDGSGNQSVSFDGTKHVLGSDWADLDFAGTDPFSLEAWVVFDTTVSYAIIVHKQAASAGVGWDLFRNDDNLHFNRDGSADVTVTAFGLSTGTTYYVVATYDGATMRIYINGSLIDSAAATNTVTANTVAVAIGRDQEDPGGNWDGKIDEVAIYDRALTQAEITEHYEVGRGII